MAFNNLEDCDASDVSLWANQPACKAFELEVNTLKSVALRALIEKGSTNHDTYAEKYKAYEKILSLIEEARKLT